MRTATLGLALLAACAGYAAHQPSVIEFASHVPVHAEAVKTPPGQWGQFEDTRLNKYAFSSYSETGLCVTTTQFSHTGAYLQQHPHHFQLWLLASEHAKRADSRSLYPSGVKVVEDNVASVEGPGSVVEVCFAADRPLLGLASYLYLTGGEDVPHDASEPPKQRVTEIAWRVGAPPVHDSAPARSR